jgi:shikimate kinase
MTAGDKSGAALKTNIILIGFMGTGKTAVGTELAVSLGRIFIDTDLLVEEKSKMSITDIFEQLGESEFRKRESEAALELTTYRPGEIVAATGGGITLQKTNRDILAKAGTVVLLTASPRAILRRVGKGNKRPLLQGPNRGKRIENLFKERETIYSSYDLKINTTGKTVKQVSREIISRLGQS